MRSFCICLCLFFAGLFSSTAQNQEHDWKWQNPLPTPNSLQDIQFVDPQTGWAVGSLGTILKTTNAGISWIPQSSRTNKTLYSVFFSNHQTGCAVGDGGTIRCTSNGGQNWTSPASGFSGTLRSVYFVDPQTGWIAGNSGHILHTTNGGKTWKSQNSGTENWLNSVHFLNHQIGWAAGWLGTIIHTTNGGLTWQLQSLGNNSLLHSVHFVNEQKGFAVGQNGTLLKTINGGQSWDSMAVGTTNTLYSIHFSDAQTGWAVGFAGSLLRTTNQGQSWQLLNSGIAAGIKNIAFSDSQTVWLVGGSIWKSTDGGQNWVNQFKGVTKPIQCVHFLNNERGWAAGADGTILQTKDKGQNWIPQVSGTTAALASIHFINPQMGWVSGYGGKIKHTTNGGLSWEDQISGVQNYLRSIFFRNPQKGWAAGSSGLILRTSNGGLTWKTDTLEVNKNLNGVHFPGDETGWAVGDSGRIYKTTDAGQSWQIQTNNTFKNLSSVQFVDLQNGWAVGVLGTIIRTTNGGQSWHKQISGTTATLSSVNFSDSQNGLAAGATGTVLRTTNGGITWKRLYSGTSKYLSGVQLKDPFHGWVVGDGGSILTTTSNNYQSFDVPSAILTGEIFEKNDSHCVPSNIPVSGILVKATPGPFYAYSPIHGKYSLSVPLADSAFNLTLQPIATSAAYQITTVCPPSGQFVVSVDTLPDTLSGRDFGIDISPCHHLDVQLSSNRRRRCFVNTTSVAYVNQGALSAPDAYILIEFPHWVRPLSASTPHVALSDSVWRFNLGDVAPGSGGSFTIRDSVLCGDVGVFGLSQCTKATVFPAPDCPAQNNWSGAEVSVSGKCENGLVKLGIYNRTAVNMPDSVGYWVFLDSVQVKTGKLKLAAGDSLKMNVVPGGKGVYLSVGQVANHPGQVFVSTAVEGCGTGPQPLSTAVSTHLPVAQRPNSKTQCLPIIGAYDPNDKQVFPMGFTNQNVVAPDTRLEYLVRFQNTGNDTAFTVYVIDTLDQNLNVESFEMGAASHPFELSMQTVKSGKTFLRWQFNNILLPDSNTNEPASNGFIQFRISPKPGLALGSKVRNHAEIYFDFNPPILTNQTLSTFDNLTFTDPSLNNNVVIVTSAEKQLEKELGVKLYPNPARNLLNAEFATSGSLTLYNTQGQVFLIREQLEGKHLLPLDFPPGLYWVKVQTKASVRTQKLVKQ